MTQLTSQIFLNIALGTGFLILISFLCAALYYVIRILRDLNQISETAKNTAEKINEVILEPMAIIQQIYSRVKPYISMFHDQSENVKRKFKTAVHSRKKKRKNQEENEET